MIVFYVCKCIKESNEKVPKEKRKDKRKQKKRMFEEEEKVGPKRSGKKKIYMMQWSEWTTIFFVLNK